MGWIKDAKAKVAFDDAERSWIQGHTVLLYSHNIPMTMATLSGLVPDSAEVIEAIESVGWRLADMEYAPQHAKNGSILFLFRRPIPRM